VSRSTPDPAAALARYAGPRPELVIADLADLDRVLR
jgi:hypothetical protein